jgi:hypothetical protein
MMVFGAVFLAIDMYFVVWVVSLKLKLPQTVGKRLAKAMFGRIDNTSIGKRLNGLVVRR